MIDAQNTAANEESVIIRRLQQQPIRKIAVIDDAYDPFNPESVYEPEIREFVEALLSLDPETDKAACEELDQFCDKHLGKKIQTINDVEDDVLNALWNNLAELRQNQALLEGLFKTWLGKLDQMQRIETGIKQACTTSSLEELVSVNTHQSTIADDPEKIDNAEVILLDYVLGDEANPDEAKRNAEKTAEKLYGLKTETPPLIVLMSSDPNVLQVQDEFQNKSGLLKGLFYCVTKNDLEDPEKLRLNLLTWSERREKGIVIHKFTNAVQKALNEGAEAVSESVKNLSLEDYAYVSDFSLRKEGQPLGEYMAWLFASYLGRLAFENAEFGDHQARVDKISFDDLPIRRFMPSIDLARMYDSALFNRSSNLFGIRKTKLREINRPIEVKGLDGVSLPQTIAGPLQGTVTSAEVVLVTPAAVPKSSGEDLGQAEIDLPALRLGLLFFKDVATPVLMVMNPECDLAFTDDGLRRPASVIKLMSGKLIKATEHFSGLDDFDTEFFQIDDETYHIDWEVSKITHVEYPQLQKFLDAYGYEAKAILKIPFVLKIQQEYAGQLSRIGLPVAPPIEHGVGIEVFLKNPIVSEAVKLGSIDSDNAFLVKVKKEGSGSSQLHFRVTIHFLTKLLDFVRQATELVQVQIEKEEKTVAEGKAAEKEQATQNLTSLQKSIAELGAKVSSIVEKYTESNTLHVFKNAQTLERVKNSSAMAILLNGSPEHIESWQANKNSVMLINLKFSDALEGAKNE